MSTEHETALEQRLGESQQRLDAARRGGEIPGIVVGARLVLPYDSERMPEWLVLALTQEAALLVPLDDDLDSGSKGVVLRVPPQDGRAVAWPSVLIEVQRVRLHDGMALAPVSEFYLGKVRARFDAEASGAVDDAWAAEVAALLAAWPGRRVSPKEAKNWGRRTEVEPRMVEVVSKVVPLRPRMRRYWPAAVALAACALLAVFLTRPFAHHRIDTGLYALRGAGEAGVELLVNGERCLANEVGGRPCWALPGEPITVRYRLDPNTDYQHIAIILERQGQLDVLTATTMALAPTMTQAKAERCPDGLCALPDRLAVGTPSRVRALLLQGRPEPTDLLRVGRLDPPTTAIEYTFDLQPR